VNILLAVRGDKQNGLGHIQRQLVLARALESRGAAVEFASEPDTPGWERIVVAGYTPDPRLGPDEMPAADVLVIDVEHGPSAGFLELAKRRYPKVVTVYGGASFPLAAPDAVERLSDLVLCQSVFEFDRPGHVLQGPRYLIIDPSYRKSTPNFDGPVIVCMGGADPHNLTALTLDTVAATGRDVIGIIGPAATPTGVNLSNHIAIAVAPTSLVEYFQGASLFVGAMGMVAYEALAAGLPCILTNWSNSHTDTTVELGRLVGAVNLGLWDHFSPAKLRQAVQIVLGDRESWAGASARCGALIDGQGAARCAEAICRLI